jgi:DNA-binding IscR family transcriptional regulator
MKQYFKHLDTCNLMQDWSEADDAFANTPQQFRDADYYVAIEEMNAKRQTCTCGMEQALKEAQQATSNWSDVFTRGTLELKKANRVEVITPNGREYVCWEKNQQMELSFQDGGRTLKIFVKPTE